MNCRMCKKDFYIDVSPAIVPLVTICPECLNKFEAEQDKWVDQAEAALRGAERILRESDE